MLLTAHKRRIPYPNLIRWLALCLPVGLYHLWQRRVRLHFLYKMLISTVATAFATCLTVGVIGLFSMPSPVMAQTTPLSLQRDIYPLVVDMNSQYYHLEGCIHAPRGSSMPITLAQAARRQILADERCNPPRYTR